MQSHIDAIEISYFQKHKNLLLELHPRMNVIVGPTDSGKSSVIRAEKWLAENRPVGDAFVSSFAGKDDITMVANQYSDGSYVIRSKSKNTNEYETDEFNSLTALKGGVPTEVRQKTLLNSVNIQTQHDPYFLLNDSPGNVAKKFNSISGLEELEFIFKEINTQIRSSETEIKSTEKRIEVKKAEIIQLEWVKEADEILIQAEEIQARIDLLKLTSKDVATIITLINKIQPEYEEVINFLKIEKSFIKTAAIYNSLIKSRLKKSTIANLVDSVKQTTEQLKYQFDTEAPAPIIKEVKTLLNDVDTMKKDKLIILDMLQTIKKFNLQIIEAENKISNLATEEDEILTELGVCPTCNKTYNEK